eukprot:363782-Chlamydomonas_euryale.AAC.4
MLLRWPVWFRPGHWLSSGLLMGPWHLSRAGRPSVGAGRLGSGLLLAGPRASWRVLSANVINLTTGASTAQVVGVRTRPQAQLLHSAHCCVQRADV